MSKWNLIDWTQPSSITDQTTGLISRIGRDVQVDGQGLRPYSDHIELTDVRCEILSTFREECTFTCSAIFFPPFASEKESYLVVALHNKNGAGASLWLYSDGYGVLNTKNATYKIPIPYTPNEKFIITFVASADTLRLYVTPESQTQNGEVLIKEVRGPDVRFGTYDAIGFYVKGATLRLYSLGLADAILLPIVRPIAIIGAEDVYNVNSVVMLDGTSSSDPNHLGGLSYEWYILKSPTEITLEGAQYAFGQLGNLLVRYTKPGREGNGYKIKITESETFSITKTGKEVTVSTPKVPIQKFISQAKAYSDITEYFKFEAIDDDYVSFGEITLTGGTDSNLPVTRFVATVEGQYEFGLVVRTVNGIPSEMARRSIFVETLYPGLGTVPDTSYMWSYFGDVWRRLVGKKEAIEVFWSALLQKCSDVLLRILQAQDELSITEFPVNLVRRWIPFKVIESVSGSFTSYADYATADAYVFHTSDAYNAQYVSALHYLKKGQLFIWRCGDNKGLCTVTSDPIRVYVTNVKFKVRSKFAKVGGIRFGIVPLVIGCSKETNYFICQSNQLDIGKLVEIDRVQASIVDIVYVHEIRPSIPIVTVKQSGHALMPEVPEYDGNGFPKDVAEHFTLLHGAFDLNTTANYIKLNDEYFRFELINSARIHVLSSDIRKQYGWVRVPDHMIFMANELPGNDIAIRFVPGIDFSVSTSPGRIITITVPSDGVYLWEIVKAFSDPTYPKYNSKAAKLVRVFCNIAFQQPFQKYYVDAPCTFVTVGGADCAPLSWQLCEVHTKCEVLVGVMISTDVDVFPSDYIGFGTTTVPTQWIQVEEVVGKTVLLKETPYQGLKPCEVAHTRKIRSSLNEIKVVPRLQTTIAKDAIIYAKNVDYVIRSPYVEFTHDIFESPSDAPFRLWAEVVVIPNLTQLRDTFGVLVGLPPEAFTDERSLLLTKGLLFLLYRGPCVANLRIGSQMFAALPAFEASGVVETIIQSPDSEFIVLEQRTDDGRKLIYQIPSTYELETNFLTGEQLKEGDRVSALQPICKGTDVIDYMVNPHWYKGLLLEIQKYHAFAIKVSKDAFSTDELKAAIPVVRQAKPAYTEVLFTTFAEMDDVLELTDVFTPNEIVYFRDDRFTVDETDIPFMDNYTHQLDCFTNAGITNAGVVHKADSRPFIPVSENLSMPADIIIDRTIKQNVFDFQSSMDNRQKIYCDRFYLSSRDVPEARVCMHFPADSGLYAGRYAHHLLSGSGTIRNSVLVDEEHDFISEGVAPGDLVTFPLTGGMAHVDVVDTHRLTFRETVPDADTDYVIHAESRYSLYGYLTLMDETPAILTMHKYLLHQSDIRLNYYVHFVHKNKQYIAKIVSYVEPGTLIIEGDSLPLDTFIYFDVIPSLSLPNGVLSSVLATSKTGVFSRSDYIFKADMFQYKPESGTTSEWNISCVKELRDYLEKSEPNYVNGFYVWADYPVVDYPRDMYGNKTSDEPRPYLDYPPTGPGNETPPPYEPPWMRNPDAWKVRSRYAGAVYLLGSNLLGSVKRTKYPTILIWK